MLQSAASSNRGTCLGNEFKPLTKIIHKNIRNVQNFVILNRKCFAAALFVEYRKSQMIKSWFRKTLANKC